MKKSILAIFTVIALASCERKETTVIDSSGDSLAMVEPADNTAMPADSANMSQGVVTLADPDKKFADDAATGGMMEVMMGDYAAANGANAKVKDLGKMISADHQKANAELKAWAMKVGYTLPSALKPEQQKMVDGIMAKKGADLDKAYTDMMVSDHKKDIAAFKKQSAESANSDLKAFAMKTVPTLEGHLKASEEAMKALK